MRPRCALRWATFARTDPHPCMFVPHPCGPVTSLCLSKEKSPRERTPPAARSLGILPIDCAIGLRGSLTVHPWTATNARASCARPSGPVLHPLAGPQGDPGGRSARSCAQMKPTHRGFRRSRQSGHRSSVGAAEAAMLLRAPARYSLLSGPLRRRWTADEKARRGARRTRARSPRCRMHRRRTPADVHVPSALRKATPSGWPSLWFLSLGQARERSRPAGMRDEHARSRAGFCDCP